MDSYAVEMWRVLCVIFLLAVTASARPKSVTFGRWFDVKWMVGPAEETAVPIKVRALLVNGEPKEFVMGEPHQVTDRIFVVQRAIRVNDRLPDEDPKPKPQWSWRPAGWLMVERGSGKISKLVLPDFDPYSSEAAWYRDMVAYCGVGDSANNVYAVVMQIGRRKPLIKKSVGAAKLAEMPYSECEAPQWQKQPPRITFQAKGGEKASFEVRNFVTELPPEQVESESSEQ